MNTTGDAWTLLYQHTRGIHTTDQKINGKWLITKHFQDYEQEVGGYAMRDYRMRRLHDIHTYKRMSSINSVIIATIVLCSIVNKPNPPQQTQIQC